MKCKLYENNRWKQHTDLQEIQIIELLKFVLNNSYFKFNGSHHHQVSGCAMGFPVSAIIAEIVMPEIEIIAITPTEHGQQISFLDIMLIIDDNCGVKIDVHRKSTHTNKYLMSK